MDEFVLTMIVGSVAAMLSAWALIRAVGRTHRERLPVTDILKSTSLALCAIWLAGWALLSFLLKIFLWAPILLIPITAPLVVFASAVVVRPDKRVNSWAGVEYSFDHRSFTFAGCVTILVGLLPQLWAALTQVGM